MLAVTDTGWVVVVIAIIFLDRAISQVAMVKYYMERLKYGLTLGR
jgi:hypothetical protein